MKRLIIGIDCDDVLIDSTYFIVNKYNNQHGAAVQLQNAHVSGNAEWNADRQEVHSRINSIQLSEEYGRLAPGPEAVRIVNDLAKLHELHLITARSEAVMDVTRRMLDTYFAGCFESVDHVGQDRSKGEVCRALNIDVLVDDNIKHLHDASECGVKNLLWFGSYEWQRIQAVPTGIRRCVDWPAVKEEIDRVVG